MKTLTTVQVNREKLLAKCISAIQNHWAHRDTCLVSEALTLVREKNKSLEKAAEIAVSHALDNKCALRTEASFNIAYAIHDILKNNPSLETFQVPLEEWAEMGMEGKPLPIVTETQASLNKNYTEAEITNAARAVAAATEVWRKKTLGY